MNLKNSPTMLMILDGFGCSEKKHGNAIALANTPNLDEIFAKYPHTTLGASGLDVGLPQGQMGNSEVGHLNIGAGRVVYQELTRISKSIDDGDFFENKVFLDSINSLNSNANALHLIGLLSDGGVHSHIDHLKALLNLANSNDVQNVYVHCFLDGRDVPPRCAEVYLKDIEKHMKTIGTGKIATISGRYYSMDRDKRWDRVSKAYDAMVLGIGHSSNSSLNALSEAYGRDENDEFVLPTIVDSNGIIKDGDSVIMFNFRPDRAREITRTIVDKDFSGFKRAKTLNDIKYVCMTNYDSSMPKVSVAYPPENLTNTLGEYLAANGIKQLRIAETEKYAHVTFFFNGGVETPNKGEDRILIPSPDVATYDLKPEMSAEIVTANVLENLSKYDVIILNFANADMVGHTGMMNAAINAIEALDKCVNQIVEAVLKLDGQILLTADHGNADVMLDENDQVVTAHSLNKVPLVYISNSDVTTINPGKLADLAPTLLKVIGLNAPKEMTGHSLI
ncbi:MAG: 2,3-bisphosphoglycerate-independent phosphoglycerate mutase [Anaerovoracaceae bacterium]